MNEFMAENLARQKSGGRFVEEWPTSVIPIASVAHPGAARALSQVSAAQAALPETAGAVGGSDPPGLDFALAVARGLSDIPRRLDSRYLYDSRGSQIFEDICKQPEYYLTRAEATILAAAAGDIADKTGNVTLVELGSGSSIKTQILLDAFVSAYGSVDYRPIDVSASILEQAENEISARLPAVNVEALNCTYDDAFPHLASLSPAMLLFLGSSAGNLDSGESDHFWENVSTNLQAGDYCLLGIDINEDPRSLHAAYNDAAGHSAAFTRNLFARMNRELGASIDTGGIDHVARYVSRWRRVEIFARFNQGQRIDIVLLGSSFGIGHGELILTEVGRKFRLRQMVPYLCTFGLSAERIYTDPGRRFAVLLLKKI